MKTQSSPSLPPSQGLFVHECPHPLIADGDKETPLSKSTALLLEVGARQQRGHRPNPSVESPWQGPRSGTPTDYRDCFLLLWNGLQAWSALGSVRSRGSDHWERPNQSGAHRWAESSQGIEAPRKKLCLKDTANGAWKSADGGWFYQSLEPETIKIKLGKKSLNEELFPNPGELISYVSFLKSHWVTKSQVHGFGSEVVISAASQCRPASDLLPVRVRFPPWRCAAARASESS